MIRDHEVKISKGMLPKQIQWTEGFCCLSGDIWEEFSQDKMALRQYCFLKTLIQMLEDNANDMLHIN